MEKVDGKWSADIMENRTRDILTTISARSKPEFRSELIDFLDEINFEFDDISLIQYEVEIAEYQHTDEVDIYLNKFKVSYDGRQRELIDGDDYLKTYKQMRSAERYAEKIARKYNAKVVKSYG